MLGCIYKAICPLHNTFRATCRGHQFKLGRVLFSNKGGTNFQQKLGMYIFLLFKVGTSKIMTHVPKSMESNEQEISRK